MAAFPGSVKTFPTWKALDRIFSSWANALQDEVVAIEAGYLQGTAPLSASHATVKGLDAADSTLSSAVIGRASVTALQAVDATVTRAVVASLQATDSTISRASVADATLTRATVTNLQASDSTLSTVAVARATATNLQAADSTLNRAVITNLQAADSTLSTLAAARASVTNLQATDSTLARASVTNLQAAESTLSTATLARATISALQASESTLSTATVARAVVANLQASDSTFSTATAARAVVTALQATESTLSRALVTNLQATESTFSTVTIGRAVISALHSSESTLVRAVITSLQASDSTLTRAVVAALQVAESTISTAVSARALITGLQVTNATAATLQAAESTLSTVTVVRGIVTNLHVWNATAAALQATDSTLGRAVISQLQSGESSLSTLVAVRASITNLQAGESTFSTVTTIRATVTNLQAADTTLSTLTAARIAVTLLQASDSTFVRAVVSALQAAESTISTATLGRGVVTSLQVSNATVAALQATDSTLGRAVVSQLQSGESSLSTLITARATVTNLQAAESTLSTVTAIRAVVTNLQAADTTLSTVTATRAVVTSLQAAESTLSTVSGARATFTNLQGADSTLSTLTAGRALITGLQVTNATVVSLQVQDSTLSSMVAAVGRVDCLQSSATTVASLQAGNTTAASLQAGNTTISSTLVVLGRVGIGTTAPQKTLEVLGDISLPSGYGDKSIYTWKPDDPNWRIGMSEFPGFAREVAAWYVQFLTFGKGAGQGFAVGDNETHLSAFEVTGSGSSYTAYFRGNVGLGTIPARKLHVNGDALVAGALQSSFTTVAALQAGNTTVGALTASGILDQGSLQAGATTLATLSVGSIVDGGSLQSSLTTVAALQAGNTTVSALQAGNTTVGALTASGIVSNGSLQANATTLGALSAASILDSGPLQSSLTTVASLQAGPTTLGTLQASNTTIAGNATLLGNVACTGVVGSSAARVRELWVGQLYASSGAGHDPTAPLQSSNTTVAALQAGPTTLLGNVSCTGAIGTSAARVKELWVSQLYASSGTGHDPTAPFQSSNTTVAALQAGNTTIGSTLVVLGRIGVGTTAPQKTLEVMGDISIPSYYGDKSIYTWGAWNPDWRIGMSANPGFARQVAISYVQYVTCAPSLGYGFAVGDNVTGLSAFEVTGSGSGYKAYFRGNVGLGTDPTRKLHVDGDGLITGALQSSATTVSSLRVEGNASLTNWQVIAPGTNVFSAAVSTMADGSGIFLLPGTFTQTVRVKIPSTVTRFAIVGAGSAVTRVDYTTNVSALISTLSTVTATRINRAVIKGLQFRYNGSTTASVPGIQIFGVGTENVTADPNLLMEDVCLMYLSGARIWTPAIRLIDVRKASLRYVHARAGASPYTGVGIQLESCMNLSIADSWVFAFAEGLVLEKADSTYIRETVKHGCEDITVINTGIEASTCLRLGYKAFENKFLNSEFIGHFRCVNDDISLGAENGGYSRFTNCNFTAASSGDWMMLLYRPGHVVQGCIFHGDAHDIAGIGSSGGGRLGIVNNLFRNSAAAAPAPVYLVDNAACALIGNRTETWGGTIILGAGTRNCVVADNVLPSAVSNGGTSNTVVNNVVI